MALAQVPTGLPARHRRYIADMLDAAPHSAAA